MVNELYQGQPGMSGGSFRGQGRWACLTPSSGPHTETSSLPATIPRHKKNRSDPQSTRSFMSVEALRASHTSKCHAGRSVQQPRAPQGRSLHISFDANGARVQSTRAIHDGPRQSDGADTRRFCTPFESLNLQMLKPEGRLCPIRL